MTQDLLSDIKANQNTFTKAEQRVASYVLRHTNDVLYMSISDLAAVCKVGETSVFRFCQSLGRTGYHDFKVDLAHSVGQAPNGTAYNDCIVDENDETEVMMQKTLNNCISILHETYQLLNPLSLRTATHWLVAAKRICFFGVGASFISAAGSYHRFLQFCPKVECQPDSRIQAMRASLLTSEDVAILFSYTGSTPESLTIARIAKAAGAKVIVISRFSHTPLAKLSDLVLLCAGTEGPFQCGSLSVKTTQFFLTELLAIHYLLADASTCEDTIAMTSHVLMGEKI